MPGTFQAVSLFLSSSSPSPLLCFALCRVIQFPCAFCIFDDDEAFATDGQNGRVAEREKERARQRNREGELRMTMGLH